MDTLRLPFEDHDGTLSALVAQAINDGAEADRDMTNVADSTFNLRFKTKRAADAFAKLAGILPVEEVVEPVALPLGGPETPAAE